MYNWQSNKIFVENVEQRETDEILYNDNAWNLHINENREKQARSRPMPYSIFVN